MAEETAPTPPANPAPEPTAKPVEPTAPAPAAAAPSPAPAVAPAPTPSAPAAPVATTVAPETATQATPPTPPVVAGPVPTAAAAVPPAPPATPNAPSAPAAPSPEGVTRWVIGQTFSHSPDGELAARSQEPPSDLKDVEVSTADKAVRTATGHSMKVTLGSDYDPGKTHNHLLKMRAYLVRSGQPLPPTGQAFLMSGHRFTEADASTLKAGESIELVLPTVPSGQYVGVILNGFAT